MSIASRLRHSKWLKQQRLAARRPRRKAYSRPAGDEPTDGMREGDGYYHDQHGEPDIVDYGD